jgi:hypothetical protein
MNPTILIAVALAFVLSTGGAYIKGRGDGGAIARAEQSEVLEVVRKARAEAQMGAADAIAKIEIKQTTIRQTLEKEIHEKHIYRDCRNTEFAMRRINSALTGSDVSTEQ